MPTSSVQVSKERCSGLFWNKRSHVVPALFIVDMNYPHRATAASGSLDSTALYVAFLNGTEEGGNSVICKFMWRSVLQAFGDRDVNKARTIMGSVVVEWV